MAVMYFGIIPADMLLYLIALGFPVALFAFLLIHDIRNSKKHLALYFESDKHADIIQKEVKEGKITIGKKVFYVDEDDCPSMPDGYLVKSLKPLHLLRWNMTVPLTIEQEGLKIMSPSNMKNFIDNKALDQLLTPKGSDKMMFLMLILGLVMGGVVGYMIPTMMKGG